MGCMVIKNVVERIWDLIRKNLNLIVANSLYFKSYNAQDILFITSLLYTICLPYIGFTLGDKLYKEIIKKLSKARFGKDINMTLLDIDQHFSLYVYKCTTIFDSLYVQNNTLDNIDNVIYNLLIAHTSFLQDREPIASFRSLLCDFTVQLLHIVHH